MGKRQLVLGLDPEPEEKMTWQQLAEGARTEIVGLQARLIVRAARAGAHVIEPQTEGKTHHGRETQT